MEITLDKINKTEALIKVKLKEDDYQPSVTQKIKDYSKKANIKGFRQGKVPEGLIKKLYGKSILADELNSLLSQRLNNYIKESDLQFLGEPLPSDGFDSIDLENQREFEFEYSVGFAEDFEVKVDKKVKVDKHLVKVDDKAIHETIENLQRRFGDMATPDTAAARDTLYGQIKNADGSIDKELNIDLSEVEKSAEKKLIGSKVEDHIDLEPKKLYKDSHKLHHQLGISHDEFDKLKGKLTFTVKGISRQVPAPVNQELFDKTFGEGTVKDETEFKEKVKESVGASFRNEEEQFFDHQLRETLIDKTKINLPDEFLKKWLTKTNDGVTPEVLNQEYSSYAKELKWSLIRNKIVKDQGIKTENEEVVAEAKNLIRQQFGQAGMIGQIEDKLDLFAQNYLQGENGDNYLKVFNQVQNRKVFDFIKSTITIKEKKVTLDEFRKL